jgi:hypothetical protein
LDDITIIDHQYNCVITDNDGYKYYVFSNHIHNNDLHHWKGWQCSVGLETLLIDYDSKIYDGVCKNTHLGDLNTRTFTLPSEKTTCNQTQCSPCSIDLASSKTNL